MIVKEYFQNINVYKPRNYFERWYADVWKRRIGARIAAPGVVEMLMGEELKQIGATFENAERGYRFKVTYRDEQEYMMFVLKWS